MQRATPYVRNVRHPNDCIEVVTSGGTARRATPLDQLRRHRKRITVTAALAEVIIWESLT
jgi:hypothetical protein